MDWLQHTILFLYLIVHCVLAVANMTFKTMMGRACLYYIFNPKAQFLQNRILLNTWKFLNMYRKHQTLYNQSTFSVPSTINSCRYRQLLWTWWLLWEDNGCTLPQLLSITIIVTYQALEPMWKGLFTVEKIPPKLYYRQQGIRLELDSYCYKGIE